MVITSVLYYALIQFYMYRDIIYMYNIIIKAFFLN